VICHANPKFGGNMRDQALVRVADALLSKGIVCLRFNFRGTGRSSGSGGSGVGEVEDVRAALDFLQEQKLVDRSRMLVAGYSFGCWVALKAAANDPRARALIGIAPPLNTRDFSFLDQDRRPKLLMVGDRDAMCSKERFEKFVSGLPEPKRAVVVPGADHFKICNDESVPREIVSFVERNQLA
jgi:alpha/beta superfamily hydrolase